VRLILGEMDDCYLRRECRNLKISHSGVIPTVIFHLILISQLILFDSSEFGVCQGEILRHSIADHIDSLSEIFGLVQFECHAPFINSAQSKSFLANNYENRSIEAI
jgi:hypothetical protein